MRKSVTAITPLGGSIQRWTAVPRWPFKVDDDDPSRGDFGERRSGHDPDEPFVRFTRRQDRGRLFEGRDTIHAVHSRCLILSRSSSRPFTFLLAGFVKHVI